jgi:PHD/YefM family antitoxin component YafN of YafNO toxin-antitoxin module
MKQLSATEARAKLSTLVAEVDKGKGAIAIAQRSKVKALLVDPEWHGRVEEELTRYRSRSRQSHLKLRGSMALTGDLEEALQDLRKEREPSLESLPRSSDLRYRYAPLVFWSRSAREGVFAAPRLLQDPARPVSYPPSTRW